MAYEICLAVYRGPLDNLLHLVQTDQVDVRDVSLATIGAQYRESAADLDVSSEYMVLLAALVRLKASLLLPRLPEFPEAAVPDGPAEHEAQLTAALGEKAHRYQEYRRVAAVLQDRAARQRGFLPRPAADDPWWEEYARQQLLAGLTRQDLARAWQLVLQRQEALDAAGRQPKIEVHRPRITLVRRMAELRKILRGHPQGCPFGILMEAEATRLEVVVTFLALLELCRLGLVRLKQEEPFGSITAIPATRGQGYGQATG